MVSGGGVSEPNEYGSDSLFPFLEKTIATVIGEKAPDLDPLPDPGLI